MLFDVKATYKYLDKVLSNVQTKDGLYKVLRLEVFLFLTVLPNTHFHTHLTLFAFGI